MCVNTNFLQGAELKGANKELCQQLTKGCSHDNRYNLQLWAKPPSALGTCNALGKQSSLGTGTAP